VAGPSEVAEAGDILDTGEAGGRAIRGGGMRVAGYVAGALLTLVSVPLLVRHLGVADFGRYTTVVSLVAIVAGVTEAGIGSVAVREYAAMKGQERWRFMRDILGARIVLTSAGVAAALAFAAIAGYASDMVVGTLAAGLGLLVGIVQGAYMVPLGAYLRLGTLTALDLLRTFLTTALVVALVAAGAGLVAFLAAPVPIALLLLVLTVVLVRGQMPFMPAFHPGRWWPVVRELAPLAAATALGSLYFRMAIIVMSLIAVELETGYFSASYRVIEALAGIPALLVGVTFPILARAARDDPERMRYAMQRIVEVALIVGGWMTIATALGAGFAMDVIGGDEAEPAADVLRIQSLYLVACFGNLAFQTGLLALRMHREMMLSALAALICVLVLLGVLVPAYDARGAAMAVVASEVVLAAVEAGFLWRAHRQLRPQVGVVPKVLLAAAASVAAALLVGGHDVVRVAVATAVYVAALAALRAIPPELVGALLRRAS
jgi:O-antigen/teichoic acid export membrane protein